MCAGLGVLAVAAWKLAGMQYKEIAEVASWQDAVALAKQQRVRRVGVCPGCADPAFPPVCSPVLHRKVAPVAG